MTRDRSPFWLLVILLQIIFAAPSLADENCIYKGDLSEAPLAGQLHRGVNLSGWWDREHPKQYSDRDLKNIKDMGFDFVRIPVTPEWLSLKDGPMKDEVIRRLHCNIISVLNNNLAVVFDLHPGKQTIDAMNTMPPAALLKYLTDIWKDAVPALADAPANRVALQLLNEPDPQLTPIWWKLQGSLVNTLRETYPHHLFIVSSIQNGYWSYTDVKPYDDRNLLYDFHFYQPMYLTHHGAEWLPSYNPAENNVDVPYPVTSASAPANAGGEMKEYVLRGWNKDKLAAEMASITEWAKHSGVRLVCLEFGVYRPHVGLQPRLNWLQDMREILDANHIPWAVWEYNEGFGISAPDKATNEKIRTALGLTLNQPHSAP